MINPVAYITPGGEILCTDPECCNGVDCAVHGTCIDRKCGSCGETIKANREYGRAAWRKLQSSAE